MANTQEYEQQPVGGGFGNAKVACVAMNIEDYVSGGVTLELPGAGYHPLSLEALNPAYKFSHWRQADGTYKIKAHDADSPWAEAAKDTNVGYVFVWVVGR